MKKNKILPLTHISKVIHKLLQQTIILDAFLFLCMEKESLLGDASPSRIREEPKNPH